MNVMLQGNSIYSFNVLDPGLFPLPLVFSSFFFLCCVRF